MCILLLFIVAPIACVYDVRERGGSVMSLFCCVLPSFAIISVGKRELVNSFKSRGCCCSLPFPHSGLQCVIVEFPGHTHLGFQVYMSYAEHYLFNFKRGKM